MADHDKPSMRRSLKLVAPDVAPHRALILFGVLALLLEVAFRVLEPWPLKIVVDAVTAFRGAKVSHQRATGEQTGLGTGLTRRAAGVDKHGIVNNGWGPGAGGAV